MWLDVKMAIVQMQKFVLYVFSMQNKHFNLIDIFSTRKGRLIFTIVFNVCFIPLAISVIKDYQRDEFSKRFAIYKSLKSRIILIDLY